MTEKKFVGYITTYRGTGRPDRSVVREGEDLEVIDPMAWHNGAWVVGVFDTLEAAEEAVHEAWVAYVTTDDDGYTQWG